MLGKKFDWYNLTNNKNVWLEGLSNLAPNHKDYLAPETNIRKFADLFNVVEVSTTPQYGNWWRIFGKPYDESSIDYPSDTSLQRAYLKMISDGNHPQTALGYLFMKDGKIL